jgi:hypothetical protein
MKNPFKKPTVSGDWFYMNSNPVTVRDIEKHLANYVNITTEIWEDAGVLEVNLSEKSSLDFEAIKPYFKDKEGQEYLQKNDIQALYMVTFQAEDYDVIVPIMKHIMKNLGGFFCEDTVDFSNVIR